MKTEMMKRIGDAVIGEIGEECRISFREVTKNNGSVRQAAVIHRTGYSVSLCIYIDGLLDEIEDGRKSIHDVAVEIVDIYRNADSQRFSGIKRRLDKESILKKVVYQLVNTERNFGRLCNMPHKDLLDLSAIYKVIVNEDRDGIACITMSHEFCSAYNISEGELDIAARKNTKEKGFCVMHVEDILAELTGIPAGVLLNECPPMFVLTSTERNNGAAVMLYREYFEELAGKLKSDLYVMPSSIHEVIAVPTVGFNPDELRKMVAEVNAGEVADEEVLGESVYRYDLRAGKLEIVQEESNVR